MRVGSIKKVGKVRHVMFNYCLIGLGLAIISWLIWMPVTGAPIIGWVIGVGCLVMGIVSLGDPKAGTQ